MKELHEKYLQTLRQFERDYLRLGKKKAIARAKKNLTWESFPVDMKKDIEDGTYDLDWKDVFY